jgi:hypothetical protein
MEFIKKRICLEPFKSRIPAMLATVDNADIINSVNGAWGKIPKTIILWGSEVKYQTLMSLYYSVLKTIMTASYYEYDASGDKWIDNNFDWRDSFLHQPSVVYYDSLPNTGITDRLIVGITSNDNLKLFYDDVSTLFNSNYNGFDLVTAVNEIIGRHIIPYAYKCMECGSIKYGSNIKKCVNCGSNTLKTIQEPFVPYFIFYKDLDEWINILNGLKTDICCERKKYESYGGDAFLEYLTELKSKDLHVYDSNTSKIPTIDIPILITTKIRDVGQYRTYNVDIISEDGEVIESQNNIEVAPSIVITQAESKLQTLRKRKYSVDDNGVELPFILKKEVTENGVVYNTELPFCANYVKNTSSNGEKFYGDTIAFINEKCEATETTEGRYLSLVSTIKDTQYQEGDTKSPVNGLTLSDVNPDIIRYGSKDKNTLTDVVSFFKRDVQSRELQLRAKLITILNKKYPSILCLKQEFTFNYELIYGIDDEENTYEDKDGNIITPIKEEKIEKTYSGTLYITYDSNQIEFIYVLGGRFKHDGKKLILDEISPFSVHEEFYSTWDGEGIWYRESYPIKKNCVDRFLIDNETRQLMYDVIDFDSKKTVHSFHGIDFPRKNYILCEEVMYKSDAYVKDATSDTIFKDEKMLGLNYPLKEKYDVLIERGTSAAHERHIQLTELKTWQDLENYRNGMFLNK